MDKCGVSGATGDHRRQQRALRLVFEQRGDELKLVSTQRLNMIVPPPQALAPQRATRGSWFELRDREGRPVYRRTIDNPRQGIEVVADAPGEALRRIDDDQGFRAFFVVVPDIADARKFVLHAEPRLGSRDDAAKAARNAATHEFDLSDIDKGAQ
ncbi:hypothetical protein [Pseudoxanthomonas sacheonensis]|uniref:Uncharacterized protein n=1 Tax=Pseudoxanthomonas sacheonensis TaxID=443615 RepID=A0ABU1RVS2_9GAMM|nr:hypothetical protein [Pseudoxanthomonas sacheonensis]MDR6842015.1 hypothetical protein [Pseudoxanthomonas sacheonensis]